MAVICKRCRKLRARDELLLCDRDGCRGEFVEEADFVSYLSTDDINLVAKRVVRTGRFWGGLGVAVVVAVGGFWAIAKVWIQPAVEKKAFEYQTNANQKVMAFVEASIQRIYTESSNRLVTNDETLKRLDTNLQARLTAVFQDLTNRIRLEFEEPRIKRTISEVASLQAKELMEQRVGPQVAQFTNELAAFRLKAETNIFELRTTADLALLLTKAASDDRAAFNELVRLRETGSAEVRLLATEIVRQISEKLMYDATVRDRMINVWAGTTNSSETATLEDYKMHYQSVPALMRMFLIHDVYIHQRFPMHDRLNFLVEVAKNDPSLQCAFQACFCIGSEAKLNYSILGLPLLLNWWDKNGTNYVGK